MRDKIEAERANLAEAYSNLVGAPGAVRGPVFEQVKAQIIDEVHSIFRANGFSTSRIRSEPGTYPRPRYVVQQVDGYGPTRRPSTRYKIVDTMTPVGPRDFKRVGVAYDATDARHIAEMFEARST